MELTPIGVIRTPFTEARGTPIQPSEAAGASGTVELYPDFVPGLADIEGFERIWLLYMFDRSRGTRLTVTPFLDTVERGLFATRAPCRPNPVGLSSVRLLAVEGNLLRVADVDMLDGSPLIDIKPYVPRFDAYPDVRHGWLERASGRPGIADDRFER